MKNRKVNPYFRKDMEMKNTLSQSFNYFPLPFIC